MRGLQLVIFDCDGVLVDSEPLSCRVLAQMLGEQGLTTTPVAARRAYQGLLLADICARAESELGRSLPEDWADEFEHRRNAAFERELRAVDGAREAIEHAVATGLDVCVASQGKLTKTRLTLGLAGLRSLFADEALFSAYSVARGKPAPDLFLHAANAMGAQPDACLVVEDTPSGVAAAVAAEMRVLGLTADGDKAALLQAGAEPLASMRELPALLASARATSARPPG